MLLLLQASTAAAPWLQPPEDAQHHALGAGFLTLLIVGMALRLLPGFAGARAHAVGQRVASASIWLGHTAAVLRVAPPLLAWLTTAAGRRLPTLLVQGALSAEAAAGVAGTAAIVCLATALRPALRPAACAGHLPAAPPGLSPTP